MKKLELGVIMKKIFKKKSVLIIVIFALVVILYQIQFYIFPVSIKYNKYGAKVNVVLTAAESKNIKKILKNAVPASKSSCGFNFDVSINIGTKVYLIAQDGCASYQYFFRFYDISSEDIDYIHNIFDKYGGKGFHS